MPTTRRPLAVINGDLAEIPIGDSIATDLLSPTADASVAFAFFSGG